MMKFHFFFFLPSYIYLLPFLFDLCFFVHSLAFPLLFLVILFLIAGPSLRKKFK